MFNIFNCFNDIINMTFCYNASLNGSRFDIYIRFISVMW